MKAEIHHTLLSLLSQAIDRNLSPDLDPFVDLYDADILDSLTTIAFIALVEEEFSMTIPPALLIANQTRNLHELAQIINREK